MSSFFWAFVGSFQPVDNVLFNTAGKQGWFLRDNGHIATQKTWSKVKYLLDLDTLEQVDDSYRQELVSPSFVYGVGDTRSLLDYYHFCNIHEELKDIFPNYAYRSED